MPPALAPLLLLADAPAAAAAAASHAESGAHADPIAGVVLSLAIVLMSAKLGGSLAARIGQPAVLGELVIGMLLGNLGLVGITGLEHLKTDPALDLLSRLGILILLFEVGLESTVRQMLQVGLTSFLVALFGVIAPFALGWGVGAWLLPEADLYVHLFLGATLTATSVGITARVLKDLGQSQSREARIILGAAVLDDVLGLVILAVVTGIIGAADRGGTLAVGQVLLILGKALGFLVASLVLGVFLSPRLFHLASRLNATGVLLATGLSFCFVLSYLASAIGLAPIVGAFAAGLILEDVHYSHFVDRGEHGLEDLIHPLSAFLVPVFFVVMGMRTDLRAFAQTGVLGLAAALTGVAILGKQACSLGALGRGLDRLSIGLGMVPRGEVGLIFANIGLSLSVHGERIITTETYSAVVVVVIVTTMFAPPALKWSFGRRARKQRPSPKPSTTPSPPEPAS
ncbi:MAG TPA: cation:proton antiporter [Polyangia bacterium]|jgi:Kef-type K+ transport system membrane component KefB|nr:cation:proton antiporter [Polyangia bacterium]